jgi:hypothetical protein
MKTILMQTRTSLPLLLATLLLLPACDSGSDTNPVEPPVERSFLEGTAEDDRIGLVVNSLGSALRLFQLGDPGEVREVALGASSAVTPTGLAVHDGRVAVPLGNAASVALIDAAEQRVERFFLLPSGNATGSAFTGDGALLVANLLDDEVGRVEPDQPSDAVEERVAVAPAPTDIEVVGGQALVVSGNLDDGFAPLGPGVVTALDARTLEVLGTVETGGTNPSAAAVGPGGLLYVLNTGNFVDPGSLAVIDPATLELVEVVENVGVGPGGITMDDAGRAYISGFFLGTVIYDTSSRSFLRGPDDPVCAPLADGACRGASDAVGGADGRVYQTFFGSPADGLAPWIFVYEPPSYTLADSIEAGQGPTAIRIERFTP